MIYCLIPVLGAAVSSLMYGGNFFSFFKGEGRFFACYSRLDLWSFVAQFLYYYL